MSDTFQCEFQYRNDHERERSERELEQNDHEPEREYRSGYQFEPVHDVEFERNDHEPKFVQFMKRFREHVIAMKHLIMNQFAPTNSVDTERSYIMLEEI